MAFNVSSAAIRKPTPSLVLFAVLSVIGLMAFQALPLTRSPNIDVPIVSVSITQAGAAPADLESQVTKRVEDALASIFGVKHIYSAVTDGLSLTTVELRLEVDTDRAVNDVRDAIAKIRTTLPRTIDEPIVERVDIVGQAIEVFAATAPGLTLEQLSWFIDDVVTRDLQGVRGVARVERIGGVTREIQVRLDPDRLSALGVSAGEVNAQLVATNADMAGGRGQLGEREQTIRMLGGATGLDQLAATRIVLPGGREIRLGDLGEVVDSFQEPVKFARLNGTTPVVAFGIYRSKGSSEASVADAVGRRLAELSAAHPGVSYQLIDDGVRSTRGNYVSAMEALMEGAALATVVVFVFLRNWRATLITSAALPLSILPAFAAMYLMGFSLNFVSLLAVILVTGILVDDAIVEIENIVRHMAMGKSPYRAAMEAADEIGLVVIAISLTIVAVFAPVSFMGGIPGQYFKQFGLTVAVAVLGSLLVARLLTPMMAAYFLKPVPEHHERDGWVMRRYQRLLRATLDHRGVTIALGLALFVLSIWSTGLLPTGFIPPQDEARAVMELELPPGASLATTQEKTDAVAQAFRTILEVRSVFVRGGTTPNGTREEVRRAAVVIGLTPKSERSQTQKQIEELLSAKLLDIPDVRGWYVNERGDRELNITLLSEDPSALDRAVARLEGAMRRLPGFSNVAAGAGIDRPEIRVTPRPDQAALYGVSTEAIASAVRIATIGDIDANLAKFRVGDRLIPIRVQADPGLRRDVGMLQALPVRSASGLAVPLSATADITFGQGPSSIDRRDRVRRVAIGADLASGVPLGAALASVEALPEARDLPAGVRLAKGGDAEIMAEVFDGFATAMAAGMLVVMGLLVLLFGGIFQPLTILLSLPLSLGGVILGLLLTHQPISLPVAIGILMLMGIVTKNAIILVDFASGAQAAGLTRRQAILEAGRKRARPIIMTTIAMVAGMVPSAFGVGDGGEFRAPMAIGVIGGLLVSTLLSLVFVPSLYTVMDDLGRLTGRLLRRLLVSDGSEEPLVSGPPISAPATVVHPPIRHAAE